MVRDILGSPDRLIQDGAAGLDRIAQRLRDSGMPVDAVYLLRLAFDDGPSRWVIRLVSPEPSPAKVLDAAIALRHAGQLPEIDDGIRFSALPPDDPEARRLVAFARSFPSRPLEVDQSWIGGHYFDYALLGDATPYQPNKAA